MDKEVKEKPAKKAKPAMKEEKPAGPTFDPAHPMVKSAMDNAVKSKKTVQEILTKKLVFLQNRQEQFKENYMHKHTDKSGNCDMTFYKPAYTEEIAELEKLLF